MGATVWLRRNLFRTPMDAVLTVIAAIIGGFVLWKAFSFVFITGRWDIIQVNERLLLYGRFPEAHILRLAVTVVVLAAWTGLVAGIIRARQEKAGRLVLIRGLNAARFRDLFDRLWLPVVTVLLLLALAGTAGPWLTAGAAAVAAVLGRLAGPFLGRLELGVAGRTIMFAAIGLVPIVLFFYVVSAIGFNDWGGFMLNMFLAAVSIVLCYPLGVLFALGRRSKLPLVRLVSTTFIEVVRGAPLFVLLLLANVALQFFIPASLAPSTATRAIVVFTLFTSAYMAEIVRGGLQSVPRGQEEAAKALGLRPIRQTALIILPQALRNVIPAQIGQLISLFKDTTLAGVAMGLFELLTVSTAITAQPEFRGQGLIGETLAFAALLFWVVSYTMSRESQRLEKRLGVGTR